MQDKYVSLDPAYAQQRQIPEDRLFLYQQRYNES